MSMHPHTGGGHIFAFAVRRPTSAVAHLRKKYNSYHYQIWHAGLLGKWLAWDCF